MALLRNRLLIPPAVLLIALLGGACGGDEDDGSGEDPAEVLQRAFDNAQEIDSGTFDLSINYVVEGDQGGSLDASLAGPFQTREGDIPSFDVDATYKAETSIQDVDLAGGLISTGQAAFVSYQDQAYQVPQELFDTVAQRFLQLQQEDDEQPAATGNFLRALGIDPTIWLTNLENEGTEDVEGTEAIRISGDADVAKLAGDLETLAESAGPAVEQIDPDRLKNLEQIVKEAHFEIYSGADDDVLRGIDGHLELETPADAPGPDGAVTFDFSLKLGEVNEPQEIAAPADPQPLATLLAEVGADAGALEDALGGSSLPQAGGPPEGPSGSSIEAYEECLATAPDAAAAQACAELL